MELPLRPPSMLLKRHKNCRTQLAKEGTTGEGRSTRIANDTSMNQMTMADIYDMLACKYSTAPRAEVQQTSPVPNTGENFSIGSLASHRTSCCS